MKFTNSKDGKLRANTVIRFRIGIDVVFFCLMRTCAVINSRAEAERAIHSCLKFYGEDVIPVDISDVDVDDIPKTIKLVARLFPELPRLNARDVRDMSWGL